MPTIRLRLVPAVLLVIAIGCKKDATEPAEQEPANPPFYSSPVEVSSELAFARLGAGYHHTCALTAAGDAWCWGWDDYGTLGTAEPVATCGDALDGPLGCSGEPLPVAGGFAFAAVAPSLRHTCALRDDGAAFCWGNSAGTGGDHPSGPAVRPVETELRFTALSASLGDFVTCGLVPGGQAWCWGPDDPNRGGLGTGAASGTRTPVAVAGDRRFVSLSVGGFHTCGVATDGAAWCWGGNWYGQLGIGSAGGAGGTMTVPQATAVLGGHGFTQVASGVSYTCGLTTAGGALCWGDGGAFGVGAYVTEPVPVGEGPAFASLHAGARHICGLTQEGVAYCWGANDVGQLGDGTTVDRATPTPVPGTLRFSGLTAGGGHTCGLATDGRAWCWGGNPYGQVGRPGSETTHSPMEEP